MCSTYRDVQKHLPQNVIKAGASEMTTWILLFGKVGWLGFSGILFCDCEIATLWFTHYFMLTTIDRFTNQKWFSMPCCTCFSCCLMLAGNVIWKPGLEILV